MELSKLEIKGFKSFADKTVVHFDQGVTSIVGPNGCGKSNIIDAIRWVLGEQKISLLRSEKMENVIFNGAVKRSPVQLAEVSLTITNTKNVITTDYSEVTVTRRLYRSGESEYLLNGVLCRLKDISNLFLDTGISLTNYAIIELGMINNLLNDRDNSRRALFEEAAGVSKFKTRKKETLQKIDHTDTDLERVEDLLFEVQKNMKDLEKQAKQTIRYHKIKEQYQTKSIQLANLTIAKEKKNHDTTHDLLDEQNDKKISLIAELREQEAVLEKEKIEVDQAEKDLSVRQQELNHYANEIRDAENTKQINKEHIALLENRIASLDLSLAKENENKKTTYTDIEQLNLKAQDATKTIQQTQEKSKTSQEEYEEQRRHADTLQNTIEANRKACYNLQHEYYELSKTIDVEKTQLSSFSQEIKRIDSDTDQQNKQIEEAERKLIVLNDKINTKNNWLENLKKEQQTTLDKTSLLEQKIEEIREQKTEIDRKLDAHQNEYQLTKSLVDNMEGFPEAIKFIKKNLTWGNQAPLLSDILSANEKYRIALENYLAPYLNYYVVENKVDAYEAIDSLVAHHKGKAHFFILELLNTITEPTVSPSSPYPHAFLALSIVAYDKKYEKLIWYLLKNVYIYEHDFNKISPNKEAIFINSTGTIIHKSYSLSGGSIGLFEGKKIGRLQNLIALKEAIKKFEEDAEEITKELTEKQNKLEELKQSTQQHPLEAIKHEIKVLNDEIIFLYTGKKNLSTAIQTSHQYRKDIQKKIGAVEKGLKDKEPSHKALSKKLNEYEEQIQKIELDTKKQHDVAREKYECFNEQKTLLHRHENGLKIVEQEILFKQKLEAQAGLRIEEFLHEATDKKNEINTLLHTLDSEDKMLREKYEKKEEIEKKLNESEKNYYAKKHKKEKVENEIKSLQETRQNIDTTLIQIQQALNEVKIKLNSVQERLSIEFNLDAEQIMNQKPSEKDLPDNEEGLLKEIEKMREHIEKMGTINPMAAVAYEEIKERNDFITSQKEDLVKAKESLLATINEIEETTNKIFMDAFHKIREHFILVFRSLFNENDDCDIMLSDETNPLASTINIIAKPKGKKPLSINQLSGGEKALTAIALLFSMYLLKPAPFCIFDEIDAPLDDTNIDKFNSIVRNFSKKSQFIIVTHNKRTMAHTDVVYGVTMIENGISRVVPVMLRNIPSQPNEVRG